MSKYDPKKIEKKWQAFAKAMAGKHYNPKTIEKKWQDYWSKHKTFEVRDPSTRLGLAQDSSSLDARRKFYGLIEFPYPSGAGLHVGHPRPFTAMDVICRKKRMEGYNVLFPIGFDAFGLPTENYAIKTGRPPAEVTAENIKNFTRQLKMLGYSFDWSRCIDTTDPKYYKWTQWIFLQLFKHGLAYKKAMPINWCPSCKIGLANEEVVDGKCERCGSPVEKRNKEQWMLAITKYADKLLEGLKHVDYIPQAKIQQENWIGRSEGAEVDFRIQNADFRIKVFTTRPDTLFGATYIVLSPEHKIIADCRLQIANYPEVEKYIEKAKKASEQERTNDNKEKNGVELKGIKAINPVNNEEIPIFVADYVLSSYGTGAIMAVPAHDERDWEFAKKYNLSIKEVVMPYGGSTTAGNTDIQVKQEEINKILNEKAFSDEGYNINSDFLNGMKTKQAKEKMILWLEEKGLGKKAVNYKLRDWVFSRQRYWGEPIPLVYCEKCKNKKYHYVLLHGYTGGAEKSWKPWLKRVLEEQGNTVFCPQLPNTNKPNIDEQVQYILNNTKIDENTILIGHSLGGIVILKLLEKLNKKVAKVLFVDPVVRPEFPDKPRPAVTKSCDWKFNFEKIKKLSKEFIILGDAGFKTIFEKDLRDLANFIGGRLVLSVPEDRHFTAEVEPIILNLLEQTGWIPLPESDLPLELPKVKKYEPTDTGESPLAHIKDWVNTKCPKCGGSARRETDTMPNWAGSSWYFLRYCDPKNDKEFASMEKLKYWMNVDWYNGGMEHTVLHLLYSRFWNEFLYDIGVVPTSEPYQKRTSHGMILAPDGEKMSKSRGNVINPDEMVEKFGTDAFRMYIMFMGPFDQAVAWDTNGLIGVRRFLEKVWLLQDKVVLSKSPNFKFQISNFKTILNDQISKSKIDTLLHQTIKKVSEDIEAMRFNTAISQLMILVNEMSKEEKLSVTNYQLLITLLSPFAPHLCEELWSVFAKATPDKSAKKISSISQSVWPKYDPELIKNETVTIAVQINGKLRDTFEASADISEDEAKIQALALANVQKWLDNKEPKKIIYVKGKLVSIVV